MTFRWVLSPSFSRCLPPQTHPRDAHTALESWRRRRQHGDPPAAPPLYPRRHGSARAGRVRHFTADWPEGGARADRRVRWLALYDVQLGCLRLIHRRSRDRRAVVPLFCPTPSLVACAQIQCQQHLNAKDCRAGERPLPARAAARCLGLSASRLSERAAPSPVEFAFPLLRHLQLTLPPRSSARTNALCAASTRSSRCPVFALL